MTNLTEEILEQIDAYKNEGFLMEENVVRAHMDATMKSIIIQEECENLGIFMEDDEIPIIPKRDESEHILKYILLFIPRLIMNIISKLYQWLTDLLFPSVKKERMEKAEAELQNQSIEKVNKVVNRVCTNINTTIRANVNGNPCELSFDGGKYILSWRISTMENIIHRVEHFHKFFNAYLETMINLAKPDGFNIEDVLDKLNIAADFINISDASVLPTPSAAVFLSDIPERVKFFKEKIKPIADETKKCMTDLQKVNAVIESSGTVPEVNIQYGRKIMGKIEIVYNQFAKLLSIVKSDITAGNIAYTMLGKSQEASLKQLKDEGLELDERDNKTLKERGVID